MQYREAREFAAAVFPDKDLMTYRNGKRALARLVINADRLDRLQYSRNDDDEEASGVVEDILFSTPTHRIEQTYTALVLFGRHGYGTSQSGRIGDDDARIIANILVSQFKGQIVIEDFGCYARDFHAALIVRSD